MHHAPKIEDKKIVIVDDLRQALQNLDVHEILSKKLWGNQNHTLLKKAMTGGMVSFRNRYRTCLARALCYLAVMGLADILSGNSLLNIINSSRD